MALTGVTFGCGGGGSDQTPRVTSVTLTNPTCKVADYCGIGRLDKAFIAVSGVGVCERFRMDFGNGKGISEDMWDFSSKGPRVYAFSPFALGWPGPKTLRATGIGSCGGDVTSLIHVFTESFKFADMDPFHEVWPVTLSDPTKLCTVATSFPPLRGNTRVFVRATTSPKIDFGCPFGGCVHDADGKPGSSAPPGFPFEGFRAFSLIVGPGSLNSLNQVAQGGTRESFLATASGDLKICVNDDNLGDNRGSWDLMIGVDESNAPP